MKKLPYRCPNCGGPVVKEYYGDYGRVHRVKKDGKISKRYKNIIYEVHGEDDVIIYCEDCGAEVERSEEICYKSVEQEGLQWKR